MTAAQLKRAKALRAQGRTIVEVALEVGASETWVWRNTREEGEIWKARRDQRIRDMRAKGISIAAIAGEEDCCIETVRRALRARQAA